MAKGSVAYRNMKRALLDEVKNIPSGRIIEASSLGVSLNIPARYVSYILSSLKDDEAKLVPWHRVVPKNGIFPKPNLQKPRHVEQIQKLLLEGFVASNGYQLTILDDSLWEPRGIHEATYWADEG